MAAIPVIDPAQIVAARVVEMHLFASAEDQRQSLGKRRPSHEDSSATRGAAHQAAGTSRKRAYQQLPRHLRRRAMSDNVYRIPSRLRPQARIEAMKCNVNAGDKKKKKNKFLVRSFNRRPLKVLRNNQFRQRKVKWLPTHIWHAKRFHMTTLWEYKLAFCRCDKGLRASFNRCKNKSVVYDASYYSFLQIDGPVSALTALLSAILPRDRAPPKCDGGTAVEYVIYKPNCFPGGALGPVTLLWIDDKDTTMSDATTRSLLLFLHPALAKETCDELRKFATASFQSTLSLHMKKFLQYELRGPRCIPALQAVLKPSPKCNPQAAELWTRLGSHSKITSIPPGCVLALDVLPQPRSPPKCTNKDAFTLFTGDFQWPASSGTWLSNMWTSNGTYDRDDSIPVVLIHRESHKWPVPKNQLPTNEDLDEGWDLLVPFMSKPERSLPLWMHIVFAGAHPIGLRERNWLKFESGALVFPQDYPDTNASFEFSIQEKKSLTIEWEKKPPAKRPNYAKLHTPSPFTPSWQLCVKVPPIVLRQLPGMSLPTQTLICARLLVHRSKPCRSAMICEPLETDLKTLAWESVTNNKVQKWHTGGTCNCQKVHRRIIGFVTSGEFSFVSGCGAVTAFVSAEPLLPFLTNTTTRPLLVRNPGSVHYQAAIAFFDIQQPTPQTNRT
ncbi:ribonuclease p/mrp protein subunit pop1 [Pelomyxa schiedti]|nr:ribonuclease p/mrp protein subunit pop1 [Pelomyxa schiedti]